MTLAAAMAIAACRLTAARTEAQAIAAVAEAGLSWTSIGMTPAELLEAARDETAPLAR